MAEPTVPPARYETEDITFRFALYGAASVLAMVLLSACAVMLLYPNSMQDRRLNSALPVYPAPRLQSDPHADLERFKAAQLARLNSMGWVDKAQGIVHIPIDTAMQRVAQQGIPDWPTPPGSTR